MGNIHGLEDTIIKVSALLNLIYKSYTVQMKIPMKFFVELDKLILILIWKSPPAKKGKAKIIVKRGGDGEGGTFHMRYEDLL